MGSKSMAVPAGGVSFAYSPVLEEIAGKVEAAVPSLGFLWDKVPESLKTSAQSRLSHLFGDASQAMRSSGLVQEEASGIEQSLLEDPVSEAPTTEVLLQHYAEQFIEAEELIAISFEKPEVLESYGLNAELLRSEALKIADGVITQAKESSDPEVSRRLGYYQILKNRLEHTLEEDKIAKISDEEARQQAFLPLQGKRSNDIQVLKGMHEAGLSEATDLLVLETQLKALDVWVSYEDERKELKPERQALIQKVAELVVSGKAQTLASAVEQLKQDPQGLSAESQEYLKTIQDEKLVGKLLGYTKEFPYAGEYVEVGYHSPAHVALQLQTEGGYGRTAYEMYQLIQRMDVTGKATGLVASNIVALEGRGTFGSGFKRGVYHVIRSTSLPEVALGQVLPLTLALRLAGKAQLGAMAALGARGIAGRKAISLAWATRFAVAGGAMFGIHTGADVGKAAIAGKDVTEVLDPKHLGMNLLSSILSIAGIELSGKLGTGLGLKLSPKLNLAIQQNGQWVLSQGGQALTKGLHHLFAYSGMTGTGWAMQGKIDGETAGRSLVDYWAFPAANKLNEVFFPAMTKAGMKQHLAIAKAEMGLIQQALLQNAKLEATPRRGALQGAAGLLAGLTALLDPAQAFGATETMTNGGIGGMFAGLVAALIPIAMILKQAGSRGRFLIEAPPNSDQEFLVGKNAKGEVLSVKPGAVGDLTETLLRFSSRVGKVWIVTAPGKELSYNGTTSEDPSKFMVKNLDGLCFSEKSGVIKVERIKGGVAFEELISISPPSDIDKFSVVQNRVGLFRVGIAKEDKIEGELNFAVKLTHGKETWTLYVRPGWDLSINGADNTLKAPAWYPVKTGDIIQAEGNLFVFRAKTPIAEKMPHDVKLLAPILSAVLKKVFIGGTLPKQMVEVLKKIESGKATYEEFLKVLSDVLQKFRTSSDIDQFGQLDASWQKSSPLSKERLAGSGKKGRKGPLPPQDRQPIQDDGTPGLALKVPPRGAKVDWNKYGQVGYMPMHLQGPVKRVTIENPEKLPDAPEDK